MSKYSAKKLQNFPRKCNRCSTRFPRVRCCWPTTILSTRPYCHVWTPCSLASATRQRVAESTRCARCTGVPPGTRRTRIWSRRSCPGSWTNWEDPAATTPTFWGSSGTWRPRKMDRTAWSARTRTQVARSRNRIRLSGKIRRCWLLTRTLTSSSMRGSCKRGNRGARIQSCDWMIAVEGFSVSIQLGDYSVRRFALIVVGCTLVYRYEDSERIAVPENSLNGTVTNLLKLWLFFLLFLSVLTRSLSSRGSSNYSMLHHFDSPESILYSCNLKTWKFWKFYLLLHFVDTLLICNNY